MQLTAPLSGDLMSGAGTRSSEHGLRGNIVQAASASLPGFSQVSSFFRTETQRLPQRMNPPFLAISVFIRVYPWLLPFLLLHPKPTNKLSRLGELSPAQYDLLPDAEARAISCH